MAEPVIAVIGAGEFVGPALVHELVSDGAAVRLFSRSPGVLLERSFEPLPNHPSAFEGVDTIVHLAGLAHHAGDEALYRAVNVDLTLEMARLGRQAGVTSFVFASSLSVNGHWREQAFAPDTPYAAAGPYGESKAAAELALIQELSGSPTHLSIFRPPLVYGPGVRSKLGALVRAASVGAPLPLASAQAKRSMISVRNLVHAIRHLSRHQAASDAPTILLPADDRDLTVTELYATLGGILGRRAWQPSVPPGIMRTLLGGIGRQEMFDSLFRRAVVDRAHWPEVRWSPPQTVEDGLREAVGP